MRVHEVLCERPFQIANYQANGPSTELLRIVAARCGAWCAC